MLVRPRKINTLFSDFKFKKNRVGRSGNVFFILTFYALQNRVGSDFNFVMLFKIG